MRRRWIVRDYHLPTGEVISETGPYWTRWRAEFQVRTHARLFRARPEFLLRVERLP